MDLTILSRIFGLRRTAPDTVTPRTVSIGGRVAGVWLDADEALRLSAVWACVTVIAKAIASSEWTVFREDPATGERQPRKQTATYRLLNVEPNPEMIAFGFREALILQALVYGNGFAEIERSADGIPVNLWPIMPDRAIIDRDRSGQLVVRVMNADRPEVVLDYGNVFHLHGPSVDGIAGFDMVRIAAKTLAHAKSAEAFGLSFYENGSSFGGALTSGPALSPEVRADLRKAIEEGHKGANRAFRFLLLEGGMTYQSFGVNPDEAQFIETRHLMIEEVCRFYGVPPHKIAHLLRATNNNIEHQGIEFSRDGLVPWCERLRQEADRKLIPARWRDTRTRIDLDWVSEGDAKSRAETDSILVTAGIATRNEARRRRGWNPVKGGDDPTVNPGTTALTKALDAPVSGEVPALPAPEES